MLWERESDRRCCGRGRAIEDAVGEGEIEDDVREGKVRILFSSPEALLGQHLKLLSQLASRDLIGAIAVDEAHVVLKYGYPRPTKKGIKKAAFREAYS